MPGVTLDFRQRPISVGRTVRIRNGNYSGYWGRVKSIDRRRVTVVVPVNPPMTITLDAVSLELTT